MTAEVAVMNKSAVALAADSAITISTDENHQTVFNTANTLFTLSKYQPVGIMIYNTMELGGVPWETIIKEFRKDLGDESLETVKAYCDNFFDFLCDNEVLFPVTQQKAVIYRLIKRQFRGLKEYIDNQIKSNDGFILRDHLIKIVEEFEGKEFSDNYDESFEKEITDAYTEDFNIIAKELFQDFEDDDINIIARMATLILSRKCDFDGFSGIVITGFGDDEIFPQLFEFKIDAIVLGHVKRKTDKNIAISDSTENFLPSKVIPFAQNSSTTTILEGLNPNFRNELYESAFKLITELPENIIDNISELDAEQKEGYLKDSVTPVIGAFKNFVQKLSILRQQNYTAPIENAISVMPIGELATVAEVFVNLEQIQQRMSMETETVGGPIDVAVISKHDGFVWIKRKHYFDINLNPGFVETYFK